MNITVIGAGAVGGYFGGRLHESGENVTFLVRERRLQQLDEKGLKINSVNGDTTIDNLQLETDVAKISHCDLVLLSVKGYHLDGVIPQLEVLVQKGAKILPLLNGVEHYDVLAEKLGRDAVLGGLCFIITTLDHNGHILHTSKQHGMIFGPLVEEQKEVCERFSERTKKANFDDTYSVNILKEIWKKYAYIVAYSGVTTASRLEIGQIRSNEETLALYKESADEMQQLAKAYGIDLGDDFGEKTAKQAFDLPEQATSSMHQDFRKGLTLEVESLQGGALRLAEKKGLDLPIVRTLYRLIKPYEQAN
ncbi:ketopantoate reductase family protein [Pueribacillus sp. YX66]|uniref:ketopantoate reductase family protein n=1 Tax=Pueribacillus sp. YX66 TaxID=3229242 RepID=UPI00358D4776